MIAQVEIRPGSGFIVSQTKMEPTTYTVWLRVGVQQFRVFESDEPEAQWMALRLIEALENVGANVQPQAVVINPTE